MQLCLLVQRVSNSIIIRNCNLTRTSFWYQSLRYISLTKLNQKISSSIYYKNKIFNTTIKYDFCIREKKSTGTLFDRSTQNQHFCTSNISFSKRGELFSNPFERIDFLCSDLNEIFEKKFLSQDEWLSIIKEKSEIGLLGKKFSKESFDTYILRKCLIVNNIDLALSYMSEIPLTKINFLALSYYFILFSKNINTVGKELFLNVFNILKNDNDILPVPIQKNIIEALCNTEFWHLAVPHIKLVEESINSKLENRDIYNHYARALIRNESWKEGMDYLISKKPSNSSENINFVEDKTIEHILCSINQLQNDNEKKEPMMLFSEYLQNFDVILDENNAEMMCTILDDIFKVKRLKIGNGECCQSCGSSLMTLPINEETVVKLKDAVENAVVKGPDIFRTTTPREWQAFVKFLEMKGPFDVVIDGLNLLWNNDGIFSVKKSKKEIYAFLKNLRKHYKNILIVSRVHTKRIFEKLQFSNTKSNNVWTFYLDNITKDDVYILYAALYSGFGCHVITRDYLRNHLFVIQKYAHLAKSFLYWQKLHQLIIPPVSSSAFKFFQPYHMHRVPQYDKMRKSWHIPVQRNEELMEYFEHQDEWICISDRNASAHIKKMAEIEVRKKDNNNNNSAFVSNLKKVGYKLKPKKDREDISIDKFKVSNKKEELPYKGEEISPTEVKKLLEYIWEEDMSDKIVDTKRNKCKGDK